MRGRHLIPSHKSGPCNRRWDDRTAWLLGRVGDNHLVLLCTGTLEDVIELAGYSVSEGDVLVGKSGLNQVKSNAEKIVLTVDTNSGTLLYGGVEALPINIEIYADLKYKYVSYSVV